MAGMSRNPAGDMCNGKQMMQAFDKAGKEGANVTAAGRVSAVGGMKKEPGQPGRTAGGPGPANG